jgi:hypothetical protein
MDHIQSAVKNLQTVLSSYLNAHFINTVLQYIKAAQIHQEYFMFIYHNTNTVISAIDLTAAFGIILTQRQPSFTVNAFLQSLSFLQL